jgi:hypothetical protein
MAPRTRIAAICYAVNAFVSLALGLTYLLRDTFMPYHRAALGVPWEAVDPAVQTLLLALMTVTGAGWIALGLVTLLLIAIPLVRGERWARLAIPALFLVFYVPAVLATVTVLQDTPATPPWYGNLAACIAAIAGFAIDMPWRRRA